MQSKRAIIIPFVHLLYLSWINGEEVISQEGKPVTEIWKKKQLLIRAVVVLRTEYNLSKEEIVRAASANSSDGIEILRQAKARLNPPKERRSKHRAESSGLSSSVSL